MLQRLCLSALIVIGTAFAANAQQWPSRPIKMIVPTSAGSATDIMARLMANDVQGAVGGTIVVENIGGSSGIPAHQAVARAEPDGYTFMFTNTSGLAINAVTFKKLPYDPAKDFMGVAVVTDLAPQMISVHKDVPVKTLPELIAWVKANPGKVSYGVDATAGAAVFYGRLINRRAGLDMAEVPYRTAAQMVQDAAAARLQVMVSSIVVAQPFVEKGDIRQIALFSSRRFPTLPNLPTVAETIPGTGYDGWFTVIAPAGTPAEPVARMNKAIGEFLKKPDTQDRLHKIGLASSGTGTPDEVQAYIRKGQEQWKALAQELSIEAQ